MRGRKQRHCRAEAATSKKKGGEKEWVKINPPVVQASRVSQWRTLIPSVYSIYSFSFVSSNYRDLSCGGLFCFFSYCNERDFKQKCVDGSEMLRAVQNKFRLKRSKSQNHDPSSLLSNQDHHHSLVGAGDNLVCVCVCTCEIVVLRVSCFCFRVLSYYVGFKKRKS